MAFRSLSRSSDCQRKQVCAREIRFALEWLGKAPNNQSPYNYIRGFASGTSGLKEFVFVRPELESIQARYTILTFAYKMAERDKSIL